MAVSIILTPKTEIQLYTNELIGHNVINRGLFRLWDNDNIVYEASQTNLRDASGTINTTLGNHLTWITENQGDIAVLEGYSGSWISAYSTTNTLSAGWEVFTTNSDNLLGTYATVRANSAVWGGTASIEGLSDTDITNAAVPDGYIIMWDDTAGKWIATDPSVATGSVSQGTVSAIVQAYDNKNDWTAHLNGSVPESRHLTSAWYEAFLNANDPRQNNAVATLADVTQSLNMSTLVTLVHSENSGVDGGTFTNGSQQTRSIGFRNNYVSLEPIVSNQVSLSTGAYYIEGSVGAGPGVGPHRAYFKNINTGVQLVSGSTGYDTTPSEFRNTFEIASNGELCEIQHECTNTVSNSGYGVAAGFGDEEIYLNVNIWRFQDSI